MITRIAWLYALAAAVAASGCSVNQFFLGEEQQSADDGGVDDGNGDGDGGGSNVPCIPAPETCDGTDNDCDGKTDEAFQLDKDPANCGACGNKCNDTTGTMVGACVASSCSFTCLPGLNDVDPAVPGCEYACIKVGATDLCDGIDDDCDGTFDEDTALPGAGFCKTDGACSGAAPACSFDACANRVRVHCTYGANVQIDPATCDVVAQESPCDDADNDCDGDTDETYPTKNASCDDGGIGVCRTVGVNSCNATKDGVECDLSGSPPPQTPSNEDCNGKDDDCDGDTDEDAPGVQVTVGSVKVDAYEASRPDASALTPGVISTRACSKASVMPWSTVTHMEAELACAAAGKRLCTATEWQAACRGPSSFTYPYGNTYQPNSCNGNDYDVDCTLPDTDQLLATGTPMGCPTKPALSACVSGYGAYDMSGNLKEWTSTQVGANAFRVRGGAYDSAAGGLACTFDFVAMDPTYAFPNLGFRCCQD